MVLYTFHEDMEILKYIIAHGGYRELRGVHFWKGMERSGRLKRTWQSLKERFQKKIFPKLPLYDLQENHFQAIVCGYGDSGRGGGDRNNNNKVKSVTRKKNITTEYTHKEEVEIMKYILEQREFGALKGNRFWKEMAASGKFTRTWQSIKEHFRKKMVLNLEWYASDEQDLRKLRDVYFAKPEESKRLLPESKKLSLIYPS